jgi:DNA-binding NtrC family response regulator
MPSPIDIQKKRHLVALLVLPSGKRRGTLLSYIESRNLTAAAVDTCRAARECMNINPTIDLVITQVSLKDGNWCDVLACAVNREVEARVVVSSTVADERFWSEALWRGVYDVLLEPYDCLEVRRIVDGALLAAEQSRGLTEASSVSRSTGSGADQAEASAAV